MREIADSLAQCWSDAEGFTFEAISDAAAHLPHNVAILDEDGSLRFVNEAWQDFARANSFNEISNCGDGVSYSTICHQTTGGGEQSAKRTELLFQHVLTGSSHGFSQVYASFSADDERWFKMEVRRLFSAAYSGALILLERMQQAPHSQTARKEGGPLLIVCPQCMRVKDAEGVWQDAAPWSSEASSARYSYRVCPNCIGIVHPHLG
ncbi:hypothetical protein IT575_13050 [bacterium]|nr:hypothetical protein [bacterium]